jgi:diguanylate cyclase (GGDEF)-like protein
MARSSILRSELFSTLLEDESQSVIDVTGVMTLRKGRLLFSPGKKAEHFYILMKGAIRVFKKIENDASEEIANFTPGDIIGDFDFARGAEYDAFAEAHEDSELLMFPAYGFNMEKLNINLPDITSRILLNCVVMVTERIKLTRKIIIESAYWVQELYREAYEDSSTGLWKQSFITDEINRILVDPMAIILLKPDRFKILVDDMGHNAGDTAMVQIAKILKRITRKLGRGWALRFKSNETGILIDNCGASRAEELAQSLYRDVAALPPVPLSNGNFSFTGSVAWGVWPADDKSWDSLFDNTYKLLLDTWKDGGNRVVRYTSGRENTGQPP